jgi:hypothetical protein
MEPLFKAHGRRFKTDLELTQFGLELMVNDPSAWGGARGLLPDYMPVLRVQTNLISFYVLPDDGTGSIKPLALQLTPELIEDFQGAKSPETDAWKDMLSDHGVVYIDVPHGAYRHRDLWLRAVFVMWSQEDREKGLDPIAFVKLCADGPFDLDSQAELIFAWRSHGFKRFQGMSATSTTEADGSLPDEIEDLVKLALLYHMSGASPARLLPHASRSKVEYAGDRKRQRKLLDGSSLFKVVRLETPADRFGQKEADRVPMPREGFRIGVRYKVRGHFYWQAVGKGWGDHRLRWRQGHWRGPEDAPIKKDLHVLHHKPLPGT